MQKGFASILVLVGIVVITVIAGGAFYVIKLKTLEQKVCTMDVKICPDGSSVGRSGPNCEFAPCPKSSPSPTSADASPAPTGAGETASWKTFLSYSMPSPLTFRYPSQDWQVNELHDDEIQVNWMAQEAPSISILSLPSDTQDYIKDDYTDTQDYSVNSKKPITISSLPAKEYILTYKKGKETQRIGNKAIVATVKYKDRLWMFSSVGIIDRSGIINPKFQKIFHNILSTFKFLPASPSVSQGGPASSGSGVCGTVIYVPGAQGFSPGGISVKLEIFTKKDNTFITSARSGEDGKYQVSLPPGEYKVVLTEYQITNFVTVEEKSCSNLDIRINAP